MTRSETPSNFQWFIAYTNLKFVSLKKKMKLVLGGWRLKSWLLDLIEKWRLKRSCDIFRWYSCIMWYSRRIRWHHDPVKSSMLFSALPRFNSLLIMIDNAFFSHYSRIVCRPACFESPATTNDKYALYYYLLC